LPVLVKTQQFDLIIDKGHKQIFTLRFIQRSLEKATKWVCK